jgi:hypothetical protein
MSSSNPIKYVAAGVAAVVLAFGAYAVGNSNAGQSNTATAAAAGQRMPAGGGQAPPGFGTEVTGAVAAKVEAAATAEYPGTAERVMKLADGSYVAHVITSSGELHVTVSKDYEVTGSQQGGPGAGGAPPAGAPSAPSGAAPSAPSTGSSSTTGVS